MAPHRRAFGDLPQALDAIDATRTRYVDFPKLTQLPSGSAAAQDENSPPGRKDWGSFGTGKASEDTSPPMVCYCSRVDGVQRL